jgi:hypothetical protein
MLASFLMLGPRVSKGHDPSRVAPLQPFAFLFFENDLAAVIWQTIVLPAAGV